MKPCYAIGSGVVAPIGIGTMEAYLKVKAGHSSLHPIPTGVFASQLSRAQQAEVLSMRGKDLSIVEQMAVSAGMQALAQADIDPKDPSLRILFSSTKGNIALLNQLPDDKMGLAQSAKTVAQCLQNPNEPFACSNACISGSLALAWGLRFIGTGQCEHALVIGVDQLSEFVLAGFGSFHALSKSICRPFDAERDGINLGTAAAAVLLSAQNTNTAMAQLSGAAITNDANHLSGPSKTGRELSLAIDRALAQAGLLPAQVGAISTHGTGTLYNDEMEAKAIHLSGLQHAACHSLKPQIGHTLGASGIMESIFAALAMQEGLALPTITYQSPGTSQHLQLCASTKVHAHRHLIKTASGFGGANAALLWSAL